MANVNVTYQEMHSAGNRLKAGREEIDSQLSQLKRLVTDLVTGGYVTDSSSKQFDQFYEEFNVGCLKTIEGLNGMADYLSTAATTFETADRELANALNK